jgi:hypothetical protein
MKPGRSIVFVILLIAMLACSTSLSRLEITPTYQPPNPEVLDVLNYSFEDTDIFTDDLQADQSNLLRRFPLTDIYHLEATLADDLLNISGKLKVRYFNRLDLSLTEVYFRLLPNLWGSLMQVDNVSVNGNPVTPRLESEDTALYVALDEVVPSGGHVDIDLNFRVTVPQDGSSNYGTFSYLDGTLALAQFYPIIPLRDELGWRTEIYPSMGDVTVTESADYLVKISAPEDVLLAASGVRIAYQNEGDRQVITQVAALAREFYLAGSVDYQVQTLSEDDIIYSIYSRPEVGSSAKRSLEQMAEAVSIFTRYYGEYPYRELEIVTTPTSAGGVEYPGIIAINQTLYVPGETPGDMGSDILLESVVVHEVAHQWFYNIVGDDQGREPWLDEAMAQYLTYQYFDDRYGSIIGKNYMDFWRARWQRVGQEPIPIGMPVEAYTELEYGAIVYGRGPLFLVALSREMGDVNFNLFLKNYFATYSWKVATSQDFQVLAETTCSCDLDLLFNEWVTIE